MAIPWVVSADAWRQIDRVKAEHGWTMPFYSSHGTSFPTTAVRAAGGGFLLNAFLRDGDQVYRAYTTGSRGVDRLLFVNNIQDLTVYGGMRTGRTHPRGGRSTRPAADGRRSSDLPPTWTSAHSGRHTRA
jgi:predicted dithiol-disulfide oxidoreductase (DUF899 family)